jgi:chemotaxis protein histidine kinase CheA
LFVDELLGQQQVVIKSLEANYRKVPGISGATIMGDGRVAMIIDISAVTRMGLTHTRRRWPRDQPDWRLSCQPDRLQRSNMDYQKLGHYHFR